MDTGMNEAIRLAFRKQGYRKFTEAELNKFLKREGLKLRVTHLHEGNTDGVIGPKKKVRYMTIATIYNPEEGTGNRVFPIAEGESTCGKRDIPNRKLGRAVAVGRCFKQLWELKYFA